MPGTEWDSSEQGLLRPGLSESIACLPSIRDARGRQAAPTARSPPWSTLRVTLEGTMAGGDKIPGYTSLVRALALHGVLRSPVLDRCLDRQPLGLTP